MKYLYKTDGVIFAECSSCKKVLKFKEYQLPEIKNGIECFCGNVSNSIEGLPEMQNSPVLDSNTAQTVEQKTVTQGPINQPRVIRCPTCGSRNVKKISLTSKAVGGIMFGLFSGNIRKTFKCEFCGYKW